MGTLISLFALALLVVSVWAVVGSPFPSTSDDLAELRRKKEGRR